MPGGLPAGPLPPGVVRASDADRAETAGALRDEFAAGRLSHDTFLYRMNAAMEARHVTDLPPLLADLPPGEQPAFGILARVRGAWNRLTGRPASPAIPGRYRASAAGSEPGRRLTSAMRLREEPSSPPDLAPPAPLPFPRTAEGFFTIGRDSRCDLAIDHMTVSRIHARLERTEAGWTLKDLSSTNGTRVNGWRARGQVPVRAGDVVRFGDIQYLLTSDQGLPQPFLARRPRDGRRTDLERALRGAAGAAAGGLQRSGPGDQGARRGPCPPPGAPPSPRGRVARWGRARLGA